MIYFFPIIVFYYLFSTGNIQLIYDVESSKRFGEIEKKNLLLSEYAKTHTLPVSLTNNNNNRYSAKLYYYVITLRYPQQ